MYTLTPERECVFVLLPLPTPTPLTAVQLKMCSSFQVHSLFRSLSFLLICDHLLAFQEIFFNLELWKWSFLNFHSHLWGHQRACQYMLLCLGCMQQSATPIHTIRQCAWCEESVQGGVCCFREQSSTVLPHMTCDSQINPQPHANTTLWSGLGSQ